jgi:hypothetical protein
MTQQVVSLKFHKPDDNAMNEQAERYLIYNQVDRYPWKIADKDDSLANRATVTSPTCFKEFDKEIFPFEEAFPATPNPFRSSDDTADDLVESQRGSQPENGMSLIPVNDPRVSKLRLYIDDYRQVTFLKILQDLRNNHKVTKLNVCRRGGEKKGSNLRSRNDLALLYETIHTLPSLRLLHLSNFEACDLEDLDDTLDLNPRLETFRLLLSEIHI